MKMKIKIMMIFMILSINSVSADFINGDFETGDLTGWNAHTEGGGLVDACTEFKHSGSYGGCMMINTGAMYYQYLNQTVDFTSVDNFSFYYYVPYGNDRARVYVNSDVVFERTSVIGWTYQNIDVSEYSGNCNVKFEIYGNYMYFMIDDLFFDINVITLNKSIYYDPEVIQINAELVDYDTTNYSYTTRLYGYTYGGWGALTQVEYNESTNMDAISKTIIVDINSEWYDLPLYIKAVLTRFNKNTYETIELADSDMVYYNSIPSQRLTPSLTTDKTYYNTSEEITISYTNIQTIYDECTGYTYNHKCEHPYELYILYPIYSDNDYNQWGAKYSTHIPYYYFSSGIKYINDSITLNTSILSPQNTYVLALVGKNGNYGKTEDILLMSDSFTVYPANEYLNTNCEGRSTYNGCDIIIYYKITNNSNIIIKDNNNNIINTYYNIIGNDTIVYTIPGDLEYLNTYPNWKIYLNNTDYATSYNQDLTVYWSLFESPTETPTISPTETPDINISDQLDNLNTEVKPLKDLLFGLVYIVIDNPDYNTDNIVSENELNNWFNSIIPLSLFLCLIILYIGLHKKRE